MKKLFLSFAVLAGVCMVSCGNKAENAEEVAANDTVVAVEEVAEVAEVADSAAVDTVVAEVAEVAVDSVAK